MFNTITELFLNTYFMFGAVGGKLIDPAILYNKLYSVFLLPEEDKAQLSVRVMNEAVTEIAAYSDYARVCRIQKYVEMTDIESGIDEEIQDVITVKGEALRKAKKSGYEDFGASTESSVCKLLTDSANMGFVPALCALGFMQCEGIFVDSNKRLGIKNIERAAKWNNIEGILLALYYDEKRREINLDRLYTVTRGTLYEGIYDKAVAVYGADYKAHILQETRMLAKAFGAGIIKPDIYTAQYARFVYSDILSFRDKERALFSGHQEIISETADLPLKCKSENVEFDNTVLRELPVSRASEQDRINRAMLNADIRRDTAFRPLCICCDSEYMLNVYLDTISRAFVSAHIERIDVADLNGYDFEPTKNNVFVRSCDEDMVNVYAMTFVGNIAEPIMANAKNFLQSDKRRKFRLQHPSAIINLSDVLPICFCDKRNVRYLKPFCDVVTLESASDGEKADILAYILKTKAKRYLMDNVSVDNSAQDFLKEYSVDMTESLIDKAVRFHRGEGLLTITAAMLKEISGGESSSKTKYGFGGFSNENK